MMVTYQFITTGEVQYDRMDWVSFKWPAGRCHMVKQASPHITLAIRIRVTEDAHITRVLGIRVPISTVRAAQKGRGGLETSAQHAPTTSSSPALTINWCRFTVVSTSILQANNLPQVFASLEQTCF